MSNVFHKDFVDDNNHALPARTYTDLVARNNDTAFQVAANVDKQVRIGGTNQYFMLFSVGPAVWIETSNTGSENFTQLLDTPASYSGQAGNAVQVNAGETALEFGQALRIGDSPQFTDLVLTGDLTVQGTTTTLDTETLLVEDKNIELGVVGSPTDITADGGGITLKGTTDKTIQWSNATDSWNLNQDLLVDGHMTIGALTAPSTDVSLELSESDKAFLPNQGTIAQRDALTPIEGMQYYNLTNNDLEFYNGTAWQSMGGGDVVGPASAVVGSVPTFSTIGGKNLQDPNALFVDVGGRVGIGTVAPEASSRFSVVDTAKGALFAPKMTRAQKNAISSPATGLSVFDTTFGRYEFFTGSRWNGFETGPLNVVYFSDPSDLPTPSGGVITLEENTLYIAYNDDPEAGQKILSLSDRIAIPDNGAVTITSLGLETVVLEYTGTGTLITTGSQWRSFLILKDIGIIATNGTVFDIDGAQPVGQEDVSRFSLDNVVILDCDTIGLVKLVNVSFVETVFDNVKQGIVFDGPRELLITRSRFLNWQNQAGAVMITVKNMIQFPSIGRCIFDTNSNETVFDIQPSIPESPFIVIINSVSGTGTTYSTAGETGSITAVADASISGTVTAVSGADTGEAIFTDSVHGLVKGQIVVHSAFADSNYNGTFEVLEIVDVNRYRVHALFTATGTGSWNSDLIQFTAVNSLSVNDGVQVTDTTDYDAGYRLLGVSGTTFLVNGTFVATETGNFDSNSIDQTDPRMLVTSNVGMASSKVLAFGEMNANTASTAITDGVYTVLDVTGFVANAVTERFELTATATGVFTFTGLEDFSGTLTAVVSAMKSGSTANYRFALSIDGAAPVFASTPFSPMEVRTTKVSSTVIQPVSITPGQTVSIMVAGDGTGDDLSITDFVMTIED